MRVLLIVVALLAPVRSASADWLTGGSKDEGLYESSVTHGDPPGWLVTAMKPIVWPFKHLLFDMTGGGATHGDLTSSWRGMRLGISLPLGMYLQLETDAGSVYSGSPIRGTMPTLARATYGVFGVRHSFDVLSFAAEVASGTHEVGVASRYGDILAQRREPDLQVRIHTDVWMSARVTAGLFYGFGLLDTGGQQLGLQLGVHLDWDTGHRRGVLSPAIDRVNRWRKDHEPGHTRTAALDLR